MVTVMASGSFSENQDFEQMLENSLNKRDNFQVGDEVEGLVVLIDRENIFVDISGKNEAILSPQEFLDENEKLRIKEGDKVRAYVVSTNRGEIKLTTRIGRVDANKELMALAYRNGIPVDGMVAEVRGGGYTVMVSQIRCFCPFSQMDIVPVKDPEKFLHTTHSFRVTAFEDRGNNIVVSRRSLLEEEQRKVEADFKTKLNVGDIVIGTIKSVHDFGLFVDLGGIEALVPKSEISHSRNPDRDDFPVGKQIRAKILGLDWERKRFSLSIKQTTPQPWDHIDRYSVGDMIDAKISNIIPAGAFAELEPGLEGFIHVSKLSPTKRIRKPEDAVTIGQRVKVRISQIESKNQRISLELVTGELDPWLNPDPEFRQHIQRGIIEMVKENGIHVRLSNGMLGYISRGELLQGGSGRDLLKGYSLGREIQVAVMEIDYQTRKLFLSEKLAVSRKEQSEFDSFKKEESVVRPNSSLGNLFKDQFDKLKKNVDS